MIDSHTPFPPLTRGDQSIAPRLSLCDFLSVSWVQSESVSEGVFLPSILSTVFGDTFRGTFRGNFGAGFGGGSGGGKNGRFRETSKIGRFRGGLEEGVHTPTRKPRGALYGAFSTRWWRFLEAPRISDGFLLREPPLYPFLTPKIPRRRWGQNWG